VFCLTSLLEECKPPTLNINQDLKTPKCRSKLNAVLTLRNNVFDSMCLPTCYLSYLSRLVLHIICMVPSQSLCLQILAVLEMIMPLCGANSGIFVP